MAPVELDLSSWLGFKPDEGLFGFGADLAQIVSQDTEFAVKTLDLETRVDDGCRNLTVFFQELVDLVLEGVEFAGLDHVGPRRVGICQVLAHGHSIQMEGSCDLSNGEAAICHAVDLEDDSALNHGHLPEPRWDP